MSPCEEPARRTGYVLKMYPRFSETFILNEILALEEQGADLEIFSLRGPIDGHFHENLARVAAPVTYLALPGRLSQLWSTLRRAFGIMPDQVAQQLPELLAADPADAIQAVELACLVVERRIDHVHSHFGSVATTVARLAARLSGVPYTFTAHAKDIFHVEVDHRQLHANIVDAAAVVTVSDYNRAWLRERHGGAATPILRIYNGVDLDAYDVAPYSARPPVITGVGRLVEKKGFCYLVDAVARLRKDGAEVELDLVGAGPEEAALRAQVQDLGLERAVRFLGPLPQHRTREVVRGAAVLAAPCLVGVDGNRDGLPTVLIESMAVGTPVVTTPVTGIPEAVLDGQTGLLVPERDPATLADAVRRVLEDPELARDLVTNGRRHVEAAFDARRNTSELLALFRRVGAREDVT